MLGRIYPLVVLLVFADVVMKASCAEKGSLAFVIDDSISMKDDINLIKKSVNPAMTSMIFNQTSSLSNMVLITFNNSDAHVKVVAKNHNEFDKALKDVKALSKNDPKHQVLSMDGLILALEKSNRGSHVYVFTDAYAKDHQKAHIVKRLCQKKQSQIYFVITFNNTKQYLDENMVMYHETAQACSGLAYEVNKHDISQVFRLITNTVIDNMIVVYQATFPDNNYKSNYIKFHVDRLTKYYVVSVAGKNVNLTFSPTTQHSRYVQTSLTKHNISEMIVDTDNLKVFKIINIQPGKYTFEVKSKSETSVDIVGRSDFHFEHGFSELKPESLNDTVFQPIADAKVHLSVFFYDLSKSVVITKALILGMNDEPIMPDLPLTKISKDFYVTRPFITPRQTFKVVVYGKVNATDIMRFAKLPITPIKLPDNQVLNVVIAEGKETSVEYNSSLKLTCKVTAFPKPKISWYNNKGQLMPSKSYMSEYPYDYVSHLEMPVTKENKYMCSVVNDIGLKNASINVKVNDIFTVVDTPKRTVLEYGKPGALKCDVKSTLPMNIRWYHVDEMSGTKTEVVDSIYYSMSADRTELKIIKMDLYLSGMYVCQAYLVNDKNIKTEFRKIVEITGLVEPKAQKQAKITGIKGATVVLECNVSGVQMSTIQWQFGGKSGSKFVPLAETGMVLRLNKVEAKHEGQYKCVAENALDKDEKVTTLIVQEIPRMISSSSTTYQSSEGDTTLKIPCVANGDPKPSITWKMDGRPIAVPSAKYVVEDGALVIRHPTVADSKSYECVATNEAGSVSTTFKTFIRQKPQVVGVATKKVNLGTAVDIECRVVKGWPKPNIRWFVDNSGKQFVPVDGSLDVMHIARAENTHTGRYKCVVQNEAGTVEHVTSLTVETRPEIVTKSKPIEIIEGDIAIMIPCDITGVPQPTVTWKINNTIIVPNLKYSFSNGSLIIQNPNKAEIGKYVCEAKNYLGSISTTVEVTFEKRPSTFGTTHFVYLLYGQNKNIECEAYRSKSQSIKWFDNKGELKKKSIQITKATVSNDGNYTCHVSDKQGHTETHTYVVNVGGPPKLLGDNPLNDWRGGVQEIRSNCDSDAKPQAKVQWKYNGKVIPDSDVQDIGVIYKWGHYTCNVSNPHGSVLKDFDVKSSVCLIPKNSKYAEYMPLLLSEDGTWPKWKTSKYFFVVDAEETITLSCLNRTDYPNSFKIFPSKTVIIAKCSKEDELVVDVGIYKISELQCAHKNYYLRNNAARITLWFTSGSFSQFYGVYYYFFLLIYYSYL
ncbi:hemicentin-1-like [Spodoptera litura]|uniref:Hemolin n=1 Tax=Spodoptera litura TaxID=69820 RepID=A0A9J7IQS7_SPOLT|nr:hemicentin-1-like [Spodoptera litura]